MSLTHVGKNGRVYVRKFDHDEARRRFKRGESVTELAAEYGVSPRAVKRVVDRTAGARMAAASAAYFAVNGNRWMYDECACGARKTKRSRRCHECEVEARSPGTFDDQGRLICHSCKRYLPTDEFPFEARKAHRSFRHSQCRACGRVARQAYRERHKVPCVGCGKPALPPNEKLTTGAAFPRCRECYFAAHRATAQAGAEDPAKPPTRAEASG